MAPAGGGAEELPGGHGDRAEAGGERSEQQPVAARPEHQPREDRRHAARAGGPGGGAEELPGRHGDPAEDGGERSEQQRVANRRCCVGLEDRDFEGIPAKRLPSAVPCSHRVSRFSTAWRSGNCWPQRRPTGRRCVSVRARHIELNSLPRQHRAHGEDVGGGLVEGSVVCRSLAQRRRADRVLFRASCGLGAARVVDLVDVSRQAASDGQQLLDSAVQLRRQPREHVLEVGPGVMPVELGRLQQAHHHGGPFAGQLASDEAPVANTRRAQRPNRKLQVPRAAGQWAGKRAFEIPILA